LKKKLKVLNIQVYPATVADIFEEKAEACGLTEELTNCEYLRHKKIIIDPRILGIKYTKVY
jgi:hypothetical protein